jgi:hypothetical protein
MATPFVQGRLRSEPLSFDVTTECACCGRPLHLALQSNLSHAVAEPDAHPLFFVPLVDFTRLKASSIIDDF